MYIHMYCTCKLIRSELPVGFDILVSCIHEWIIIQLTLDILDNANSSATQVETNAIWAVQA